jgi:hypothetical protein
LRLLRHEHSIDSRARRWHPIPADGAVHESSVSTTFPCTSVNLNSRPWNMKAGGRLAARVRPDRPLVDPRSNQRDLLGGQRVAILGHPVVAVQAQDAADEQAALAVAGDLGGTRLAPRQRGSPEARRNLPRRFLAPWHSWQRVWKIGWMSRAKSMAAVPLLPALSLRVERPRGGERRRRREQQNGGETPGASCRRF